MRRIFRYIHKETDWPHFRWDASQLLGRLSGLRHLQGHIAGKMYALGFNLQDETYLKTLSADVIKSSEIEGEILDNDQVRSSIARRLGMDINGLVESDRFVDGVVDMMLDATQNYDQPLTDERLFGWHAALFPTGRSGLYKIIVGQWRDDSTGPMQVVSGALGNERVHFEAPAADRLSDEMQVFLDWFNAKDDLDPVLKAAIAHLWFVTIHPFEDGNGRIARAVSDLSLSKAEGQAQKFYSMSSQMRENRKGYYASLEATQKGTVDITDWLLWFFDCMQKAIVSADAQVQKVMHKYQFWNTHKMITFNERQIKMIDLLFADFYGHLTTSKWAKINKCSTDTALRDITDLLKKEVLKKEGRGGRSTSYVLTSGS